MKLTLIWALVVLVSGAMTAAESEFFTPPSKPGDYVKKIKSGDRVRTYRLHLPVHYDGTKALPLLIVFHGSSASASVIERETSLDERADSLNFIVAYPEGLHRGWNVGDCCNYSFVKHVDDLGFTVALINDLAHGLNLDTTKVYATGYSDGGTMSYLLACTYPEKFAAVAGVSGTLFDPYPTCDSTRKVPVMVIHGTGDKQIPFIGRTGNTPATERGQHTEHSAPDVVHFWIGQEHCTQVPEQTKSGTVIRDSYACGSSEVLFYTILGGSHGWPGGGRGWIFSPVPPKDMIATDTIVRFFLRRSLTSE